MEVAHGDVTRGSLPGNVEGPVDLRGVIADHLEQSPVTGNIELDSVCSDNWSFIKTKLKRGRVVDLLNVRIWDGETGVEGYDESVWFLLKRLWDELTVRIKINCSFGCILEHKTTGELRYFHSSSNNSVVLDKPRAVATTQHLADFYSDVSDVDIRERAVQRRPNTEWRLKHVTNITFYLFKLLDMGKIGKAPSQLPAYIVKNKSILSMNKRGGVVYNDNLCFFRCLAMVLDCTCKQSACKCEVGKLQNKRVCQLFEEYKKTCDSDQGSAKTFAGVRYEDLVELEKLFRLRVYVYTMTLNKEAVVAWASQQKTGVALHLIEHEGHFCWIKNVETFARAFLCEDCGTSFKERYKLRIHNCLAKVEQSRHFVGGAFQATNTVFDNIREQTGICVSDELRFFPFRITYDVECILCPNTLPSDTDTCHFVNRHELVSISVCSNVPGFTEAVCFVREADEEVLELVEQFYNYLCTIQCRSKKLLTKNYQKVFDLLERRQWSVESVEQEYECNEALSQRCGFQSQKPTTGFIERLISQLESFVSVVPVVGFNSKRYDLNILKAPLMKVLSSRDDSSVGFVVKQLNCMTCVDTDKFRFLDICNYIAPGFTYGKYLKAYGCQEAKGFFPYEWFDSLEKLNYKSLPPKSAFDSKLKDTKMSDTDYAYCRSVWTELSMSSFRDFLRWYNNLDVRPFLEAIDKQSSVYRDKGIDMLKSAISLPGLAIRWLFADENKETLHAWMHKQPQLDANLFKAFRNDCQVQLFEQHNADLYTLIRENIVGGPSIIFSRHHERDKTRLRPSEFKDPKMCKEVLGVDANALYLWCMMQNMPVGVPKRWKKNHADDKEFSLQSIHKSKTAHGWLAWMAYTNNIFIQHEHNGKEVRLSDRHLPVDGFCVKNQTVYQFNGCYWHGHQCSSNNGVTIHPTRKIATKQLHEQTVAREEYLKKLGYTVRSVWECEWKQTVQACKKIQEFLKIFFASVYPWRRTQMSEKNALEKIADGSFYGLIECDIEVPAELEKKFSEMAPIFKNAEVGREHLSPTMLEHAETHDYLRRPQRMLIGSLKGKKILLYSELLRWYIKHGLVVTQIYQLVEYVPRKTFEKFGLSVTAARRQGDVDSSKQLLADTNKLIGNSCYGKTITNKDKHRDVSYVEGHKAASVKIRSPRFCSAEEITQELYETTFMKKKVN